MREFRIGEEVYVKRGKIYGEEVYVYQRGEVYKTYPSYVLIIFKFSNGNFYKEGFKGDEIRYKEEIRGKWQER